MPVALSRPFLLRGWREFVYVATGLPLGIAWLVVLVTLLALGFGLALIMCGIPILAVTLLLWRWGANTERERAALVLGAPIARPRRIASASPRLIDRALAPLRDGRTWRDLGYMLLLGPVGIIAGTLTIVLWSAALAALLTPVFAPGAPDGSLLDELGAGVIGVAVASVPLAALAALVTRALAAGCGSLAQALLAADRAELEERISSLEATRSGAVESADARLRRIERDLHDGAQHRLAFIAMELGRARAKLESDPGAVDALLAGAHEESKIAMRELRDVARGIHPSVLSDRGLDAALSGLAERATVPVEIRGGVDRLPPAVETAAYYVVAETLTNVGRHSGATRAYVALRCERGDLVLEIGDDGKGGAHRRPGSGLEGLAQRVEALDGTLEVDSPEGGPTTVTARMPCAS